MRKVRVYVEGGGQDNELLRSQCRQGFARLAESAGIRGAHFVARGGRNQAYDAFCTALIDRDEDEIVLLLVDSEEVLTTEELWDHMSGRPSNALIKPNGAHEEHLFLMVACMETWLIADTTALSNRFGNGFDSKALPAGSNLEIVAKDAVFRALRSATANCKQPYEKGKLSFELLGKVDPAKIRERCPNAERFFDRLSSHMAGAGP